MASIERDDLERILRAKVLDAGIEPERFFRTLEELIESTPDGPRALTNLSRFLESGFSSALLRDFDAHSLLLKVFLQLVGQSQYLADILVRNPEWFHWLTSSGELREVKSRSVLASQAMAAAGVFESPARRRDALKRFHRREVLRIGAADILGEASLTQVVDQLSSLAEVIIDHSVRSAYEVIGMTPPAGKGLAVFGLGKLGGNELNFSSDIDLMFVYEADGNMSRPIGRIRSQHEFFVRAGEEIVDFLSAFSDEGYFYRVDMRLRPDGRSGPLALSRASYMTYYETRGAQWERQMLLKLRYVGGDKRVGARFQDDIRPFVYRRTILSSPWQDIASMKRAIEEEFRNESNIKLGTGGIRDVEFLVQGLQLVHGGTHTHVRSPNTLEALRALSDSGLIGTAEADDLSEAYSFFRDIEHRLQLFHGLQTHEVPVSEAEFGLLAAKLGYTMRSFRRTLERHRRHVRDSFRRATVGMEAQNNDDLLPEERTVAEILSGDERASVRTGVLRDFRRMPDPAVAAQRFGALLERPDTRAIVTEAVRSRRLRSDLICALALSSMVYERLSADPLLLETMIGQAQILLGTGHIGWTDLIQEQPSWFKRYNEVRSSVRFLSYRCGHRSLEAELTAVADRVVQTLCVKSGLPEQILVIGAGKLGSKEMGIASDLDLILVFDEKQMSTAEAQHAGNIFTSQFLGPNKCYDVDHRLRPEGRNAPLVSGIEYMRDYMSARAEPWERLALMRSRALWGSTSLRKAFGSVIRNGALSTPDVLVRSVREMRERMEKERESGEGIDVKVGAGGIVDIEFVAQTGLLLKGQKPGRPTLSALRSLRSSGAIRQRELHLLEDALAYMRTLETILRLNSTVPTSILRAESDAAACAAWYLKEQDQESLRTTIQRRMSVVRHQFGIILDRWGKG